MALFPLLVVPLHKDEESGAGAREPALSVARRGVPLHGIFYRAFFGTRAREARV